MMRRILVLACAAAAALASGSQAFGDTSPPALPYTANVYWSDIEGIDNRFTVTASVSADYKTWSYEVTWINGNELDHWVLSFLPKEGESPDSPEVYDLIDAFAPSASVGYDNDITLSNGGPNPYGIIWSGFDEDTDTYVGPDRTSATYSFTLSAARAPRLNSVTFAQGGVAYGGNRIVGPSDIPYDPVPLPPAVMMGSVVIGGIIGGRAMRKKLA